MKCVDGTEHSFSDINLQFLFEVEIEFSEIRPYSCYTLVHATPMANANWIP